MQCAHFICTVSGLAHRHNVQCMHIPIGWLTFRVFTFINREMQDPVPETMQFCASTKAKEFGWILEPLENGWLFGKDDANMYELLILMLRMHSTILNSPH